MYMYGSMYIYIAFAHLDGHSGALRDELLGVVL